MGSAGGSEGGAVGVEKKIALVLLLYAQTIPVLRRDSFTLMPQRL